MTKLTTDSIKRKVEVMLIIGTIDLSFSFMVGLVFNGFMEWMMFILGLFGGMCFGFSAVFYYFINQLDKMEITQDDLKGMFQPEEEKE